MARPSRSPADAGPQPHSGRRRLLGALGGLGGTSLVGCATPTRPVGVMAPAPDGRGEDELARIMATGLPSCRVTPTETEGPFPLRAGLAGSALLREDITDGCPGLPLTLRIKLVDVNNRCRPVAGAWVYVWHCDRDGRYSGYDGMGNPGQAGRSYLRGIQRSDADGVVTFKTIYPGWYEGRITHIHCMAFLAGSMLTSSTPSMATTQFAFPDAATAEVYASPLYGKGPNTSVMRIEDDGVFSDGAGTEMLAVFGSAEAGYVAGIVVGVDQTVSNRVEGGGPPGGPRGWPPGPPDGRPPMPGGGLPPRGGPGPRPRGGPG